MGTAVGKSGEEGAQPTSSKKKNGSEAKQP
jgi:hypothetical protein